MRPTTSAGSSRPGSSSFSSRPSSSQSSRPSTASSRPGSSRSIRTYSNSEFSGPELLRDTGTTLDNELSNDILLRIMSGDQTKITNEVILVSEKGDVKALRKIIETGVTISTCKGLNGYTPLHHASNRGHADVVAVLLKSAVPIDARTDDGETALHLAAYVGHLLIVEQLVDCGARINAQNNYGETPLFYAAMRTMPALVRLLLQRGADPSIEDHSGDLARDRTDDTRTLSMFSSSATMASSADSTPPSMKLSHGTIQHIYSFLGARDIGRSSCTCGKWHRASEAEEVWLRLGSRRWEFALQGSLGFAPMAAASFRPKKGKPPLTRKNSAPTSAPPPGNRK
jgi:uncharacterized lipoprotein NlpE involved in copper resistance